MDATFSDEFREQGLGHCLIYLEGNLNFGHLGPDGRDAQSCLKNAGVFTRLVRKVKKTRLP